jgi:hypothetical protein
MDYKVLIYKGMLVDRVSTGEQPPLIYKGTPPRRMGAYAVYNGGICKSPLRVFMIIALVCNYSFISLKRGARGVINSPLCIKGSSAGFWSVCGGRGGLLTKLINIRDNNRCLIKERRAYV